MQDSTTVPTLGTARSRTALGADRAGTMFPEERKDGSPRFGKLHFPVGLWINSPKKHFAKMSRRWPSVGSVKSTSSDTASRGSETVELRPPSKTKPSRHKRLSNLFHRSVSSTGVGTAGAGGRWASEKKLSDLIDPVPEDLVELSSQRNLPGILKIFGGDISCGANYKSVLATPRSTAHQLVREALERYGVAPGDGEEDTVGGYMLCDVVGRFTGPGGAWQAEHLRPVGDTERPLVLQDVWKPKAGCSRRFEIRRRREVERAFEAEDNETAGINAQARRLQKSRSRAASGGTVVPKERADNLSLRRSISDMNLSAKKRRERKNIMSMAGTEEPIDGASLEQLSQCLIQPPTQNPYFLLLQSYNEKQDFVIYVMTRRRHVFGRPERRSQADKGGYVDTFLCAPDILPRHCWERQEAWRTYVESRQPELRYRPQEEEALLREIVRGQGAGGCKLAPAFLLGLCVEHSARVLEPGHLPKLVTKIAHLVKEAVWEKIKEIGDRQPENQQDKSQVRVLSIEEVATDLRPLMLWMANAMELLNLIQKKMLDMEKELELEGTSQDVLLSGDLEMCDEAMAVLDEVIMSTFQQSVYYLTKTLYSALPALLDSNPFTAGAELCPAQDLSSMPEGTRGTLAIYQATLELTRECELHPDLVSQTFGYLFFFSNASLFNTLMEKGNGTPFYQWSKAVQIRTNLDLVLDWLQGVGLGDIATEFFRKLSTTINLLCIPKTSLVKATWSRLRNEYLALTPAQLHHLLSNYYLGLGRPYPEAWSPLPEEQDKIASSDIFESFTEHPPLILPIEGFRLRLSEPVGDDALHRQLCRMRRLVWDLEQEALPANQRADGQSLGQDSPAATDQSGPGRPHRELPRAAARPSPLCTSRALKMTLLASERSLLIRSKFRSVLQLRMQHRRSQEQLSEQHVSPAVDKTPLNHTELNGTPEQSRVNAKRGEGAQQLQGSLSNAADRTLKPRGQHRPHNTGTAKGHFREDTPGALLEIRDRTGKHPRCVAPLDLPLPEPEPCPNPGSAAPEAFPFDEDFSSSSSLSSPSLTPSPTRTSGNSSPSSSTGAAFQPELPSVLDPQQPTVVSASEADAQTPGGSPVGQNPSVLPKVPPRPSEASRATRPRKAKEPRPKVKKLKYHQYVPPAAKPARAPTLDTACARLLQHQQLVLQLQVLHQRQGGTSPGPPTMGLPLGTSLSTDQMVGFPATPSGTMPPTVVPVPPIPATPPKSDLLPANLDDLTVSELRQQLRQRGLPVSGTKPALLERLRPFQVRGPQGGAVVPPAERALQEKQRLIESLRRELRREQQQADDLRQELERHQRLRGTCPPALPGSPPHPCPLPGDAGTETETGMVPTGDAFVVFCPTSCEPIGPDPELPLQITASPASPPPAPRSLEEELQEAIQRAQLVPSESIEDILEEPLVCAGDLLPASPPLSDAPTPAPSSPRRASSPTSLQEALPAKRPRCSSSGNWLEALTSGSASGLGPSSPIRASIFSTDFFDSPDLSVNHMIDLMVEQW
ncbi:ras-interacting protein 1 isoform A [Alligator mississippiensis]|uniref:Ras-interacting protein 1 isoform A n=1 Tax=Alligator mississippiensis TaxID=8496 RepID=A0A151MG65_ALLMI|nr:ras-interacting protein 1 isoform A [Alligator mississippiensis]